MSQLYVSLASVLGPGVQALSFFGGLLLFGVAVGAAAFWGERRLVQTQHRVLWTLPFPVLSLGLIYGGLRVSGLLVYPADGWDASGIWNQTNQNEGAILLLLCGCLLAGAVLAVRGKRSRDAGPACG